MATVPLSPSVTEATADTTPSASVSLANTSIVIGVSSSVVATSDTTTVVTLGSSLTASPSVVPSFGINVYAGSASPRLTRAAPASVKTTVLPSNA